MKLYSIWENDIYILEYMLKLSIASHAFAHKPPKELTMKEILTKRLEKKLVEKEQEIAEMQASFREEMQKELDYHYELLTSMSQQMAEMKRAIEDLSHELALQNMELEELKIKPLPRKTGQATNQSGSVSMKVVSKEDDAIVMIRRR
jgi:predicted RNase H-like nuclease (RuvC/YqgF family)